MGLNNYMEDIVFNAIKELMKETEYCSCEKCMYDIAALALNELPPRYIVTERGELYTKTELLHKQYPIDIISVITRAAEIVNKNPHHDHID
ncbi:late competence development ComFB family protein [Vallitalea okinawensis]|uniref:late competence development ComFB family protein n=1 Tax=Vallitalea okinawensis TaxID=2078660 RepID=UPI000CFCA1A8|nr:late competence development ComFB family protein [Vallitalea okinawensis]